MILGYVRNQKDWLIDFTTKINILTSSKFTKIKKMINQEQYCSNMIKNYYPCYVKIFYEQIRKKAKTPEEKYKKK